MGWKDIARLGRASREEAVTSFLERTLPEEWSRRVAAARPEAVAAREHRAAALASAERRQRLAMQATGSVRLAITGGEEGRLELALPVTVDEREGGERYDDGPAPLAWLLVRVESPGPVPLGSTTLTELSLAVPGFAGPGRYDLADLMRRGEAGEIEAWEVLDLYLAPDVEAGDTTWYVDLTAGPAWLEVDAGEIRFDLPTQSAMCAIRLTGSVRWEEPTPARTR